MNDSRKTTDWFDAQLRKAKDDFARLGKVDRNAEKNKGREGANALRHSATARKSRPPASEIPPPLEEQTVNRGPEKKTKPKVGCGAGPFCLVFGFVFLRVFLSGSQD